MVAPRWRFLLLDAITRAAQAELPVVDSVSFGETLNSPGAFRAVIPLESPSVTAEMLRPPRAVFAVEKDDVLLWAGPIWTHAYDLDAGTVELAGEGYLSYLRRRTLRTTKTYFGEGGWQQETIAWDLIDYTQDLTNGNLGIVDKHTTSFRFRDRTYHGYERKRIGTLIEQLAAVEHGFDFRLAPRWTDGPNSTLAIDFTTVSPPVGRPTDIVFDMDSADVGQVALDGTALAFTVDALGAGEGDDKAIVTEADVELIAAYMQLDDDVSISDVKEAATLVAYRNRRLARGSAPIYQPTVSVETGVLGSFQTGDQCMVRAQVGLLQLNDYYRITAWEASIPASGPEVVQLTLAPLEVFA